LAGLAAAAALGSANQRVDVLETRPFLGGRATSYKVNAGGTNEREQGEQIDNCQHVLLRCCANLLDFYQRLGTADLIQFYKEFFWIEPGGRTSSLRRGILPAPLHFTESFAKLRFLSLQDKLGIGRAILAVKREYEHRADLERITMLEWLQEKKQTPRAIQRFWNQILVSAINEEVDRMAALHGLQVFRLSFLGNSTSYEMGVPAVPLTSLYSEAAWSRYPTVRILQRAPVEQLCFENGRVAGVIVDGRCLKANACILALPFERAAALLPAGTLDISGMQHSPITGVHLWFDRPVTDLPHATLLDRIIQWMFNKDRGRYVQVVISASRSVLEMPRAELIELTVRELKEFFPAVNGAILERAHVVKEVRATFSATAEAERKRPGNTTSIPNLFLAGDWTRSGWPATMEGAVRSGYMAAEAVLRSFGEPKKFVLPDAVQR
jgi:zeta-carotene desaturase